MNINNFSEFLSENKNSVSFLKKNADEFGRYVNLNILPNGNLEISLTEEGKTEIEEYDNIFFEDLIDDIRANSNWLYVDPLSNVGIASDAPAMIFNYDMTDEGRIIVNVYDDGEVFYYNDYTFKDCMDELNIHGKVIFYRLIVTPQEQKEYDINKDAELYNL